MTNETANNPQVERNYKVFKEKLPDLLATHNGKLAVMHDGALIEFFDSYADAIRFGVEKYGAIGNFSVQEVTTRSLSMGYYSFASNL